MSKFYTFFVAMETLRVLLCVYKFWIRVTEVKNFLFPCVLKFKLFIKKKTKQNYNTPARIIDRTFLWLMYFFLNYTLQ